MIAGLAAAAFLLGVAEVFRDNAAQTALPSVVDKAELERANGQLWSVEQIMGQFIGPPLAGLLIATAVPVPFIVDAVSFGLAAWLIWCISMPRVALAPSGGFWAQFKEGAAWMARHRTILTFAIMLSLLNFVTFGSLTLLVLLSQELYGLDAAGYGILLTAGAAGAVLGGMLGPKIAGALGGLRTVQVALVIMAVPFAMLALTQSAVVAGLALGLMWFGGMTWNVVTVSLRQRVIPAQLLGRVNAIYRFFGWGSIPLGAFAAGLLVSMAEPSLGRIAALQLPFWIGAGTVLALLGWALTRLRFDGA